MATISSTLAAGSVASPYYYDVVINKTLCKKTCASKAPVFSPTFSLESYTLVGTGQYELTCSVQGVITYTPCGGCGCDAKMQLVNETFVIPLYSATAPTSVTVSGNAVSNKIVTSGCANCGNQFVSDCALTVTVATT